MKQTYRERNFKPDSLILIEQCDSIIEEYQAQGFVLTLRQLYYVLVTRVVIPNVERSYKNLSTLVTDARMAGLLDWDAIEDRGRQPKTPLDFESVQNWVENAIQWYRLPRWRGQSAYVELWVEKDALAGVLAPIARKWHITLAVNKGYSSASAMRSAAQRFLEAEANANGCVLLYLGDHDPSGEDMVRDIRDRLQVFEATVDVMKIALTIKQVRQYNPPPNPAKLTDPRAKAYIEKFGDKSWEVDALPPQFLTQIIETALAPIVDRDAMDRMINKERADVKRVKEAIGALMDDGAFNDEDET